MIKYIRKIGRMEEKHPRLLENYFTNLVMKKPNSIFT